MCVLIFFSCSVPILWCIWFRDRSRVRLTHESQRIIESYVVYVQYTRQSLRFQTNCLHCIQRLLFFFVRLLSALLSSAFLFSIQMVQGQMRISNFIYTVFLIYIYFILIFWVCYFVCCYFWFACVDCYCYISSWVAVVTVRFILTRSLLWSHSQSMILVSCNVAYTQTHTHTRTVIVPLRSSVSLRQPKYFDVIYFRSLYESHCFFFSNCFSSIQLYRISVFAFTWWCLCIFRILRVRENSLAFFFSSFTSRDLFHRFKCNCDMWTGKKSTRIHMPYSPINGQFKSVVKGAKCIVRQKQNHKQNPMAMLKCDRHLIQWIKLGWIFFILPQF